jgi:hypothetical protein
MNTQSKRVIEALVIGHGQVLVQNARPSAAVMAMHQ